MTDWNRADSTRRVTGDDSLNLASSSSDINECMEGDNPCPDICINTVGSYTCDCNRRGYRLAEDSSGCLGWCTLCVCVCVCV